MLPTHMPATSPPSHAQLLPRRRGLAWWVYPLLLAAALLSLTTAVWALQARVRASDALTGWSKHVVLPSGEQGVEVRASLFPSSYDELQRSAAYIAAAASHHYAAFLATYALAYIVKQTFSLPGSGVLNALAGIAFGAWWGALYAVLLTALGTSGAYLLSHEFGALLMTRFNLAERILPLRLRVEAARKRKTLAFYLISLRTLPVFPQWLINLASPHIGIPLRYFVPCTAVGLIPYNVITVRAGAFIATTPLNSLLSAQTFLLLAGIATVFLLPALCMRRIERALL
ncbi:TVP38/TMEM64 family protein [archaeon]|nr:MAG: TVP38/TMEM64 family protein [archaeon]